MKITVSSNDIDVQRDAKSRSLWDSRLTCVETAYESSWFLRWVLLVILQHYTGRRRQNKKHKKHKTDYCQNVNVNVAFM